MIGASGEGGGQAGQGTVEFALSLSLMIGFILFFLQLSLVFAFGNYVHYATFMAARAYLSASSERGDQEQRAGQVLALMVKKSKNTPGVERFPSIAKSVGGSTNIPGMDFNIPGYDDPTTYSWAQGVRYTFKSRVFPMPLGLGATLGDQNTVTLKSESWLGRETSDTECVSDLANRTPRGKGVYDNGC